MNGAFYISATGLEAQQRALDATANNIANINTSGFKRSSLRFKDLVLAETDASGSVTASGASSAVALGVNVSATAKDWSQGALRETGSAMDLAVDGDGLIEMMGASGKTLLWRGGTLKINSEGLLAAADGTVLRAMIAVPQDATAVHVAQDGSVTADVDGESSPVSIGQIDLVVAKDKDELVSLGGGYYEATDEGETIVAAPGQEHAGRLIQGSLEGANVELSEEMVNLLLVQRAYAANAQVVQAGDQIMSIINNLRR